MDTKLARQTKAGTILQLCLYSELVGDIQGVAPEQMHVIAPWRDFQPESWRFADFGAYYRRVKARLEDALGLEIPAATYPEPNPHCDVCRWSLRCDNQRRADDHLTLVAGISTTQIADLKAQGISTTAALATMPLPLEWKPERGSASSYERVREQARVQVEARLSNTRKHELLAFAPGFGFAHLPEPAEGDVFLDFEGDSFVGEHGLEYLVGYHFMGEDGWAYTGDWALNRKQEKQAFETFIDFVSKRMETHPGLHIYHYGGYETGALKRLMGRYATREDELDALLRGGVLVDLLTVVRQSVRASVESYSIKKLEPFFEFQRATELPDANVALRYVETSLELNDGADLRDEDRATVQSYNKDDCVATRHLRDWLELLRQQMVYSGVDVPRPEPLQGLPSDDLSDWLAKIEMLVAGLTQGVSADEAERTEQQQAVWVLAQLLEWHRREDKVIWWEYFRLSALPADDLLDERAGLAGLTFVEKVGGTDKCPIHRYCFPPQEADVSAGKSLRHVGGKSLGKVSAISLENLTVDIKKMEATAQLHPEGVFVHEYINPKPMRESLVRLAESVLVGGIEGPGAYQSARDLLLRKAPVLPDGQALKHDDETTVDAAKRIALVLGRQALSIQGPPGTGKTYTGAQMICQLAKAQKKVGIVANSHAVVRNMLNAVIHAAGEMGLDLNCIQKAADFGAPIPHLVFAKDAGQLFDKLKGDCQVAGGTAWLWASPAAFESVDVLFVDEAAQMSLANVLAASQAANAIVLLGDPQQLDQPTKGSHPDGTDCSALDHVLNGEKTISPEKGLFLEETWRLHPDICRFTSELFYEHKLRSRPGLEKQALLSSTGIGPSGLTYVPVEHHGNQNCSPEEAIVVARLVGSILGAGSTWIDANGVERRIEERDLLIIAPYNAQVAEIQRLLPTARVGTVDKFQGQEAPIAIYSLATSTYADAPRGMEFLYSLNRLNVATSRARCVSILVASPLVFEAECKTPRQIQLTNAFCRYLELAT